MSLIKHKIKLNPVTISGETYIKDANINISLSNDDNFIGFQQEIDSLTSFTAIGLINPTNDEEKRRYKVNISPSAPILTFWFYNGTTYLNSFIYAGFTINEFQENANSFLNSFFILDLYDTYDINSQSKIFTTYLTKKGYSTPTYNLTATTNQLYYWYIPESYINGNTGTTTAYAKLMFYNAKTGKVITFYNKEKESSSKSDKIHFEVELNHVNKTWKFVSSTYPNIRAYELVNAQFSEKVNNTVETSDILIINPPTGNTLTYSDGSAGYVIT